MRPGRTKADTNAFSSVIAESARNDIDSNPHDDVTISSYAHRDTFRTSCAFLRLFFRETCLIQARLFHFSLFIADTHDRARFTNTVDVRADLTTIASCCCVSSVPGKLLEPEERLECRLAVPFHSP